MNGKRSDVDEHRLLPRELNVVGGGILQNQAGTNRFREQPQMQQRRVAEHREGPLVRITDKGNPDVLENPGNAGRQTEPGALLVRNFAGSDELTLRYQLLHKRQRRRATPRCQRFGIHGPKHSTLMEEHSRRSVTKGSRVELHRQRIGIAGIRTPAGAVIAAGFTCFRRTASRDSGQRRLNLRILPPTPVATSFPRWDRSTPGADSFVFLSQERLISMSGPLAAVNRSP